MKAYTTFLDARYPLLRLTWGGGVVFGLSKRSTDEEVLFVPVTTFACMGSGEHNHPTKDEAQAFAETWFDEEGGSYA